MTENDVSMPVASRLDARDIQIAYDSGVLPIITQFTLGIRTGEFIGVVGPNGAGKSTLVRAFSRALRPARGTVLLAGQDLYEDVSARDSARQIGVVPQETAVAFDFSVREIVEMGRTPRLPRRPFAGPTAADDRAVSEALRLAGVEHLSGRSVTSLSGGERQRTMLARALAQEPDVLLLDEPTAHLDLHHQTQTLSLIRHLAHDQGMAVLAVLHDLNLASAFCDRLVLLREGTIAAQGTPEQVLTSACLQHVYGTQVWVRRHPATGRPFLLPLAEADLNAAAVHRTVHVLCGGGTGTALLFALTRERFRVTAGGLNAGDTDAEAADLLGISYPRESPFSALSTETVAETNRLAMLADIVVLSDAPFGGANLAILEAARASRLAGKPVICIQPAGSTFMARDFTGGAAVVLWQHLLSEGATVVANTEAALAEILRISQ